MHRQRGNRMKEPMVETGSCPLCKRSRTADLHFKNSYEVRRCLDCDVGFVSPLPAPEQLKDYYSESFFLNGADKFGYPDYQSQKRLNRRNFEGLKRAVERHRKGGALLDVGCATGGFLSCLGDGWERYGVELSEYASAIARDAVGPTVYTGDLLEAPLKEQFFDTITLWDTFDHLRDPLATLARIRTLLKPGGILVCNVGDLSSWTARLMGRRWYLLIPPTHLFYYSRVSLPRLLETQGFQVMDVSYPGKWASLGLAFFRLAYVFREGYFAAVCRWLSQQGACEVPLYFNFRDVMLVCARKKE